MTRFIALLSAPAAAAALALTATPAAAQSPCGDSYTVRSGDTLYSIAQRCRTSVGAIVEANERIDDPNRIGAGWTIAMPGADGASDRGDRAQADRYRIRPGDTLYAIAARVGVGLAELMAANAGIDPYALRIGDVIRLPGEGRGGPEDGRLEVTGILTREGVECPALRGMDGRLYTLAGELGRFQPGDRVRVHGSEAQVSFCQQGTTIDVSRIEPAR